MVIMKKFRKIICALAAGVMLLISAPVMANDITVILDGNELSFVQAPIIINGTTMVPMRGIFEALGCEVMWDDSIDSVFANDGHRVVAMGIGTKYMVAWPVEVKRKDVPEDELEKYCSELPIPPIIINNILLAPLRSVSEGLGANVVWDGETQTITITSPTY